MHPMGRVRFLRCTHFSSRPHAVTRIGDQRFDYDGNGNMISDPSRGMFYNANNQITLNIFAGSKKVSTRTIGTVSGLTGTGGGTLIDNGIDPELSPTLLMPYLFLFFVLFLLGSLRPVDMRLPGWACHRERRPLGRSVAISRYPWDCFVVKPVLRLVEGLLAMTRLWLSWCRTPIPCFRCRLFPRTYRCIIDTLTLTIIH